MMLLDVEVLSPEKKIFSGKASTVILPGEEGAFEILPHHKTLISRLISGTVIIDEQSFPVKRGICKVNLNKVTLIIE